MRKRNHQANTNSYPDANDKTKSVGQDFTKYADKIISVEKAVPTKKEESDCESNSDSESEGNP